MASNLLIQAVAVGALQITLLLAVPAAEAIRRADAPEWLEIRPVGEAMLVNGLPTDAQHLISHRPAAAVVAYFHELWQCGSGEETCRRAALPPWQILSRFDGRQMEYVQVRDDGLGATGYLAVSELDGDRPPLGDAIPAMQGSQVVHDLATSDPGKQGRVLQLRNGFSVAGNGNFYRSYFMDRNWSRQVDQVGDDRGVLVFHKGRAEAHVVLTRHDGMTAVVINLVE